VPIQLTASFRGLTEFPILEWMTLITSQFLHGGFLHIGGNMLYLWVFGNNIEDQLGHVRFSDFLPRAVDALAGLTQWVFAPTVRCAHHWGQRGDRGRSWALTYSEIPQSPYCDANSADFLLFYDSHTGPLFSWASGLCSRHYMGC
jgi:hypothetical protein